MTLGDGDNMGGFSIGCAYVTWDGDEVGYLAEEGSKLILPLGVAEVKLGGALGDIVVDEIVTGGNIKLTLAFEQFNVDNLKIASPLINVGASPGTLLYQYAKELVVHPRHKGSGDTTEDIVLNKTISHADIEIVSQLATQKRIPVEFIAYPDRSKSAGARWGKIWNQEF